MSQSRQLAAVMFTDIVGYTALMGNDEQKAFEILKKNREIHQPIIETYNGKLIKELGDGILASFPTVSNALYAAMKIQQACSSSKELSLRIGIHEGEIIFENNDIYGDSVNLASRIQTLGIPGSILFSKKVADEIKNKAEFHAISVGSFEFKNVNEPIEVFALANEGFPVPKRSMMEGKLKKKSVKKRNIIATVSIILLLVSGFFIYKNFFIGKLTSGPEDKSIAVLPFVDMSPDKDQEYFSDGLSEELINALAKISGLKVAGRTSSFSYKGINKNLKTIGEELGVSTILEGSLRKSGNQLRITAQLINTQDGFQLWTETFNIELTDIFGVQDKITVAIITALNVHLLHDKELAATATTNSNAYTSYLRGRQKLSLREEHLIEAKTFFEEAIKLDPNFARAHSGLARTLSIFPNYMLGFNTKELMRLAKLEARKALELDPTNAEALSVLGSIAAYYEWDWDAAEQAFRKSISVSPNDAEMYNFIGDYYLIVLNKTLAIEMESKAVELDPLFEINYGNLAMAYYTFNEYDNAIRIANLAFSMNLQSINPAAIYTPLVWAYLKLNRVDEAVAILKKISEDQPLYMELKTSIDIAKGDSSLAISNLSRMTKHFPSRIAELYLKLGMWEKAAQWIEKAYAAHDVALVYYSGITLPEDYPDHPALKKAFDKLELNKLFEIRRKNLNLINKKTSSRKI